MTDELITTDATPKKEPPIWRERFLTVLSEHGSVTTAAHAAGIERSTAYRDRATDPVFAEQWKLALDLGLDALEDAARIRAKNISDTLMIFLLKSHRPDVYRERTETKHTFEPINWDTIPPDVRDAFINGRMTLDDVRQFVSRTHGA